MRHRPHRPGTVPAPNLTRTIVHVTCPACGRLGRPERFTESPYPVVQRVQRVGGYKGMTWSDPEPADVDLIDLVREACERGAG